MKEEIMRVKGLEGGGQWVVSMRGERLFENDDLPNLKNGLGKKRLRI